MTDPRLKFSSVAYGPSSSLVIRELTAGKAGRCLRCSWRSGVRLDARAVREAYRGHLKAAHPGKSVHFEVVYRVEGHCAPCAGAEWTERVERPLVAARPDEPTYRVSDGLDAGERLPFNAGWVSFEMSTKRLPPSNPRCPRHPDESLRWFAVRPVSVEGRPASDYMVVPL